MVACCSSKYPKPPQSSQSSMHAICRTLIRRSLDNSKSFGKVTDLTFPWGFGKVSATCTLVSMQWSLLAHRLSISQIRYYLMSIYWSNHRIWIPQQSNPPRLSQRITVVFIMCTNNSLKSFCNHATSHEIILVAMYSVSAVLIATDFYFLLIHDIEAESKENQHSEVIFLHAACPISIRIIMQLHISGSVSQSMRDCAPKISQKILGTNPVRLNQI